MSATYTSKCLFAFLPFLIRKFDETHVKLRHSTTISGRWRRATHGQLSSGHIEQDNVDYEGGALPAEVMRTLPAYFFSFMYLKTLATTCRNMLAEVRSRKLWRHQTVSLNDPEFDDPHKARAMMEAYCAAGIVMMNIRHLAMLHVFPPRFLLEWNHENVHRFTGTHDILGFQSSGPLMGCASFDMSLPATAKGVYVGVRQWRADKKAFCRIDNLFRDDCVASVSILDIPPVPDLGRRVELQPNFMHHFDLYWNQHMFELSIDQAVTTRARVLHGEAEVASPLAQVFVWIHTNSRTHPSMASFKPLPSMVQLDAKITCSLCQRNGSFLRPLWSVCPICLSWICSEHIQQEPGSNCPNCPSQLLDFVGGSTFEGSTPYVDASAFFEEGFWQDAPKTKFHGVVAKVLRKHRQFISSCPSAVKLLPDPDHKPHMSKRQWEQLMFRGRAIIDFLDQRQHRVLFHFLHDQAAGLGEANASLQNNLPDPDESFSSAEWRRVALDYALQLQSALAAEKNSRRPLATDLAKASGTMCYLVKLSVRVCVGRS